MPNEQAPIADPIPELEAIVQQNMESGDTLKGIDANTEASAMKLDEIAQNQEAQIVQSMNTQKEIMPSLESLGKAMQFAAVLMEKLQGPPGPPGEVNVEEIADKVAEILIQRGLIK